MDNAKKYIYIYRILILFQAIVSPRAYQRTDLRALPAVRFSLPKHILPQITMHTTSDAHVSFFHMICMYIWTNRLSIKKRGRTLMARSSQLSSLAMSVFFFFFFFLITTLFFHYIARILIIYKEQIKLETRSPCPLQLHSQSCYSCAPSPFASSLYIIPPFSPSSHVPPLSSLSLERIDHAVDVRRRIGAT